MFSMSAMVGRKRSRCRPFLYRSCGLTFEVNTSATPRLSSAPNRPARIMASAISATNNSSKQITCDFFAIFSATPSSGDCMPFSALRSACTSCMKR
jgi:hypothetical protein